MNLRKGLLGLIASASIASSANAQYPAYTPFFPAPVIQAPAFVQPAPIIVQPQIYVHPPIVIVEPQVIVQPAPIYIPMPIAERANVVRRTFNLSELVSDTSKGYTIMIENKNFCQMVGSIPNSCTRISFVKTGPFPNDNRELAKARVSKLPGEIGDYDSSLEFRNYDFGSILNPNESYEVFVDTPNRNTGREWKSIGNIEPGGKRFYFIRNRNITCF